MFLCAAGEPRRRRRDNTNNTNLATRQSRFCVSGRGHNGWREEGGKVGEGKFQTERAGSAFKLFDKLGKECAILETNFVMKIFT